MTPSGKVPAPEAGAPTPRQVLPSPQVTGPDDDSHSRPPFGTPFRDDWLAAGFHLSAPEEGRASGSFLLISVSSAWLGVSPAPCRRRSPRPARSRARERTRSRPPSACPPPCIASVTENRTPTPPTVILGKPQGDASPSWHGGLTGSFQMIVRELQGHAQALEWASFGARGQPTASSAGRVHRSARLRTTPVYGHVSSACTSGSLTPCCPSTVPPSLFKEEA